MTNYKERYGGWVGNTRGHAPDYTRCCEEVRAPDGWFWHQCSRKRGHGPDGEYCKQHDPEAVKERQKKANERHAKEHQEWRYKIHGKLFYETLKKIADGHNDPRGIAREIIERFEK